MMIKWEYKTELFFASKHKGSFDDWLNERGQEGWEAYSIMKHFPYKEINFKRPLQIKVTAGNAESLGLTQPM